ncbi:MAG: hypothetical protein QOC62_6822 [Mycobacterium sp.]|jgi:hypothetical protein|nr:hypothetical protein [Mycobacterium sp.]
MPTATPTRQPARSSIASAPATTPRGAASRASNRWSPTTTVRSGICWFGLGVVVGGPPDTGDRRFEAEPADRGFHLAIVALIADEFCAYLDVAVGAGVAAADGPYPEFGAGRCLHQQGTHMGLLFIAGDGDEGLGVSAADTV